MGEYMQAANFIDGVILVVVLLSWLHAYSRGLLTEIIRLTSYCCALIIAFIVSPQAMPLLKNLSRIEAFLLKDCQTTLYLSFILVFLFSLCVLLFLIKMASSLIDRGPVGKLDTAMGFLYGIIRALVLFTAAFFVYKTAPDSSNYEIIDESVSAYVFEISINEIANLVVSQDMEWITEAYTKFTFYCQ